MSTPLPTAAIIGVGPNTARKAGCDAIAYAHAYALRDLGVPLVAAAARSQANRDGFAAEFPAVALHADYRAMLARHRPQLVSICAWPRDREEMALAALEHGARILWIEKPLALSLDCARRILAAAAKAGARVFVHHQRRFGHPFTLLAEGCAAGRLGTVQSVTVNVPCPNLLDFGCHLVDAAMAFLPGRTAVRAWGSAVMSPQSHHQVPVEAEAQGTVWFDDGSRLVVNGGRDPGPQPAIRVDGSHGFAELLLGPRPGEGGVLRARWRDGAALEVPALNENFHHDRIDRNLYVLRFLDEMLAASAGNRPSCVDGGEGLRSLEAILAILESARRRAPLTLPFDQAECPLDALAG